MQLDLDYAESRVLERALGKYRDDLTRAGRFPDEVARVRVLHRKILGAIPMMPSRPIGNRREERR